MSFNRMSSAPALPVDVPYSEVRPILAWAYIWMFFGLIVTAAVAWVTAGRTDLMRMLNTTTLLIILIVQLGITIAMSAALQRISQGLMTVLYMVYTALTGFTFSILFLAFDLPSIAAAFITTAGVFGVMSIIGFTTKVDLTRFGGYVLMAMIGLLLAMLVNLFLRSDTFALLINVAGVLIFTGVTAYKTQMIKGMAAAVAHADGATQAKISVYAAFTLYLTFINLFLFILRLMGRRR